MTHPNYYNSKNNKRPSIKDVRSQGVCPVRTRGGGGFFSCGRPHFLEQKTWIFRNFWYVRTDKGEGGQFFAIFCGCFLWNKLIAQLNL